MRVLVSGMGGELGTRVALGFEARPDVTELRGIDIDPPRRRLRRADFHRVQPGSRDHVVALVRDFDPHVVVHVGVYEPYARAAPTEAARRTIEGSVHILGAAAECPSLEAIVVRSGIEVYGRRRGAPTRPTESTHPDPTSDFGRVLLDVERLGIDAARAAGVPCTNVRLAPVVGPHLPSPLGRFLRMPVVPVSLLADPPFTLCHAEDAALAIVAAATARHDGAVNVVGHGAVSALQAVRLGGRIPVPMVGPEWRIAAALALVAGSPLPDHVAELLLRGRTADGSACAEHLGVAPTRDTIEVVQELYEWATVTRLTPVSGQAVA